MSDRPRVESGDWPVGTIFTIGHSTLPIDEFVAVLEAYGIARLVDVRTVPRSRHNPQFNADALAASLAERQIDYLAMPALGGLRRPRPDSANAGWRNDSFRGYADYMQTDAFREAVDQLARIGEEKRSAIMCAEAVPWRCHRSLVADALDVRGVPAVEILPDRSSRLHKLTPFARVEGGTITYPSEQPRVL